MDENEIARIIVDSGLKTHRTLGPGLYETVYEQCLEYEISEEGIFDRKTEISFNTI